MARKEELAEARALLLAELLRLVSAIQNTPAVKAEAQTNTAAAVVAALVGQAAMALLVRP